LVVLAAVATALISLAALPPVSANAATLPSAFQEKTVYSGLANPTTVQFAKDGRVFVAEKSGLIKEFDNLSDKVPTTVADLRTNVYNFWDRGVLGMVLDPNLPSNPYVYVLYTYDAPIGGTAPRWGQPGASSDGCPTPPGANADGCVASGRLSRIRVDVNTNTMTGPEQVLIEDWCQQYPSHSMGSLVFGSDGALYVSAGDGASFTFADYGQDGSPLNPCGDPPGGVGATLTAPTAEGGALRAQDMRTTDDPAGLNGAILRVDPATGDALPGNPLYGSADPNARRIIAYGLRNPFRQTLATRPGSDELWVGDVGWGDYEEVDRVASTTDSVVENFGWPCYEGAGRQSAYDSANLNICENLYGETNAVTAPIYAYNHNAQVVQGETCPSGSSSIAGMAFYKSGPYPDEYDDALFFADFSRDCIWVMQKGSNGLPDPATRKTFVAGAANPVDLQIGPNGDLFYVDFDGGTLRRIEYTGGPDTTVPTVGGVTPAEGATGVALTDNAVAPFSEDMDASTLSTSTFTLTRQGASTPVAAAVRYDAATDKATLDPSADLEADATYTATLKGGGAKDLAGNPLATDKIWSFSTLASTGSTPPLFADDFTGPDGSQPTNWAVNRSAGGTGAGATIQGNALREDVVLAPAQDSVLQYVQARAKPVQPNWSTKSLDIWWQMQTDAGTNQTIGAFLAPQAATGNVSNTSDYLRVRVSNGQLALLRRTAGGSPTTIWSGPVTRGTALRQFEMRIEGANLWLYEGDVGSTPTLRAGPIAHGLGWTSGYLYLHAHNSSSATPYPARFDTVRIYDRDGTDATAPTVRAVAPAEAATGVATTTNAEATFSEAMDPNTISNTTFTLMKQGSTQPVTARVTYDAAAKKATLDPDSDIEANTAYTATIKGGSAGVKDAAGNALASDKSWSFTTAPQSNTAPTATINAPTTATTWKVDDLIDFSGSASDPQDGPLADSQLSRTLIMHHCPSNCHTHQLQELPGVASGAFTAPDHEYPSYLELRLTATDSGGLTDTKSVRLDPRTVALTFQSGPPGLNLVVGSSGASAPFTRTVIVGSTNSISAPSPQTLGGTTYRFSSWSDGGAQTHNVVAPGTATAYTAAFAPDAATTYNLVSIGDTTISENGPTQNHGAANTVFTDGDDPAGSGKDKYALIKWDLSSIAPGTNVESSSMTLSVSDPSTQAYPLRKLKRAWAESAATWNAYDVGKAWEVAGARGTLDRETATVGSVTPTSVGKVTVPLDRAVVQGWVDDPSTNYGIIIADPNNTNGADFYSREAADASQRPQLTVNTSAPATR
jgi:glucose/arabinose dehydrogenase